MTGDDIDDAIDATPIDDGASLPDLVERLHAELRATEELPVEREASRWIGEAQAVAGDAQSMSADLVSDDIDDAAVRGRVAHVRELLDHVESTGHETADEHVAAAKRLAAAAVQAE